MDIVPVTNTIVQNRPEEGPALKDLPVLLKQWMIAQEKIAILTAELSQHKKQNKTLKDMILRIMDSNKVAALNVNRGVISHRVREKVEPVNTQYLQKHLKSFFDGDESKATALLEFLETKRETSQQHELKLVVPKNEDALSRRS